MIGIGFSLAILAIALVAAALSVIYLSGTVRRTSSIPRINAPPRSFCTRCRGDEAVRIPQSILEAPPAVHV